MLRNNPVTGFTFQGAHTVLDEKLAAKFPITDDPPFDMHWGNTRRRDGTIVKP